MATYALSDMENSFCIEKAKGKTRVAAVKASKYNTNPDNMNSLRRQANQLMSKQKIIDRIEELQGPAREKAQQEIDLSYLTQLKKLQYIYDLANTEGDLSIMFLIVKEENKLANHYPAIKQINFNLDLQGMTDDQLNQEITDLGGTKPTQINAGTRTRVPHDNKNTGGKDTINPTVENQSPTGGTKRKRSKPRGITH